MPNPLSEKFRKWYYEIKNLVNFEIQRKYFVIIAKLNSETAQLFICSYDNLNGCESVSYIGDPSSCESSFVIEKSRVTPLKKIILIHLKLLGALTNAKLANCLKGVLKIANKNIFYLNDLQVVLYSIKGSASN